MPEQIYIAWELLCTICLQGHNPSEPPYEMYPITYWDASLSSGLEGIILKCTQKNPEDRYQTAEELMYALQNYRDLMLP